MKCRGLGWGLTSLVLCLGCGDREPPAAVVVSVDGRAYSYVDFERFVERNVSDGPSSLSDKALSTLFQAFVDELCLVRMAENGDLDSAELPAATPPSEGPTREEARRHFEAHRERYRLGERVVLGQILAQDDETAREIHRRIADGVDLESAASGLEGAVFSGYQAEVTRQDLPVAFAETIFALTEGEVSEVLAADYGFHIFHVRERLPAGTLTFEQARSQIEMEIDASRGAERLRNMVAQARVRYNVEPQPQNLPFVLAPLENH